MSPIFYADASIGHYQNHFKVYGTGKAFPVLTVKRDKKSQIRRPSYFYCPKCQYSCNS
jgi:formamidopyrimidine-DNA glycosylase